MAKVFRIKKANKSKLIKESFAKSINILTLRVNRTILKQIGESLIKGLVLEALRRM